MDDDYLCHVEVEKTKIAWVRILITNRVSMNVSAKSIHTAAKIIVNKSLNMKIGFCFRSKICKNREKRKKGEKSEFSMFREKLVNRED